MKFQCDCKEKWLKTCKTRSTEWLVQYDELEMYPIQYQLYYEKYRSSGIISDTKNDERLYNYLRNNNLLGEKLCYLKIAYKLVLKDDNYGIYNSEDNVDSVIDYLVWSYGNPYDENNYLLQRIRSENQEDIREKYKMGTSKIRIGHSEYREDLIKYYEKCQICGIQNKDLLVSSHIKDFSESENYEARDLYNGFLLCKGHDGLFDKGLISFTDEGNVMISRKLSKQDLDIIKPETIKINILDAQKKYLEWNRANRFKR